MSGMCVLRPARGALSASETGRDRSSRVHQGQNKVQHKQSVQSVSLFFNSSSSKWNASFCRNLKQKSKDVRDCLQDNQKYYLWLANYLISERVLKEENFLQTYADVVEELSHKTPGLYTMQPLKFVFLNFPVKFSAKGLFMKNCIRRKSASAI